jgi:cysteine synthase A
MGIGDGIIPAILNRDIISDICIITDDEALNASRALAAKEGILCGISSGTNVAAAIKMAKKLGKGKTVVTVLPDTAERYFSTPLFDETKNKKHLHPIKSGSRCFFPKKLPKMRKRL